jgi:G3E family GTPase
LPPTDPRIPVTLLTGFLGAGKTTLLNAILSAKSGPKIAVIVNEFGAAGLDHDLIESVDEEVVLMQSGCLCCSIRGDLSRTLQNLVARQDAGQVSFERVVIETTGLADPAPILQTFLADPYLAKKFRMDGVVTVADAAAGPNTLDRHFEAVSQVAMADVIILGKADLVSQSESDAFEMRLRSLNQTADILKAERGDVPTTSLWNLSGMHKQEEPEQAMAWLLPTKAPSALNNLSGFTQPMAKAPISHVHDARIGTASVVLEEPITVEAFDHWLDTLILLRGANILRVKGIVHLEDIETPFVFHGVQHLFDPPVPLHGWPVGNRQSRIVVIARDMTQAELAYSLDMLRARNPGKSEITERKGAETNETQPWVHDT